MSVSTTHRRPRAHSSMMTWRASCAPLASGGTLTCTAGSPPRRPAQAQSSGQPARSGPGPPRWQAGGTRPSRPAWESGPREPARGRYLRFHAQLGGQLVHEPERSVLVLDLVQRGLVDAGCAVVGAHRLPTHATGRLCGRPCPSARGTDVRDRPWPSGTACAAGHAPHPAENFGCRSRDWPTNRHSPGTSIYLSTHRRSRGPSLHRRFCCPRSFSPRYYDPSDARPARSPLPGFVTGYRSRRSTQTPQPGGPGRASPVPAATICTFRAPYAGGSFTAAPSGSSPLPWPSPFSSGLGIPSSTPFDEVGYRRGRLHFTLRTAQLHTPKTGALDAGLRPRPFPDDTASLLPGSLTTTRTGLPPASDDELTDQQSTTQSINHQSLLDAQEETP